MKALRLEDLRDKIICDIVIFRLLSDKMNNNKS